MGQEERLERWEDASADLDHEQLATWWAEMPEEIKVGLMPPDAQTHESLTADIAHLELAPNFIK